MRTLVALLALLAASAAPASARQAQPPPARCTYETCAIHVERSLFRTRIVRGDRAEVVGGWGVAQLWGRDDPAFDLRDAVSASPEALVHVERYERRARIAEYAVHGMNASLLAMVLATAIGPDADGLGRAGAAGYVGSVAVGIPLRRRTRRSLRRAVDAYNESLPRTRPQ